jgi:hypothetical protein
MTGRERPASPASGNRANRETEHRTPTQKRRVKEGQPTAGQLKAAYDLLSPRTPIPMFVDFLKRTSRRT